MNDNPCVSVIMCVYNTKIDYFREAVESILNQTLHNFELFIIDDCSNNGISYDQFNDERIIFLKNEKNRGPSFSRNKAILKSKGKYIAIMDSDDIAEPNRLKKEYDFLEKNVNVVACGTWFSFFGDKTGFVRRILPSKDIFRVKLLFGNCPTILNPSAMIRKQVLIENNILYDESLRMGEDHKMWVELLKYGEIYNIQEFLLKYRIHSEQSTSSKNRLRLNNNYSVSKYQLREGGFNFLLENEIILQTFLNKQFKYKKIIERINLFNLFKKTNLITSYFESDSLKIVLDELLYNNIRSIHNLFTLIRLIINKRTSALTKKIIKDKIRRVSYE